MTNVNPEHIPHADPWEAADDRRGEPATVEIGGVTMTAEQFRAARAGLAAGVASETEHKQLREVFAPRTIAALQKRAYDNSAAHGFHETDKWLDGLIIEGHTVADDGSRDLVIPAEFVNEFVIRLQELRDAYRGNRLMLIAGEVTEAHEELRSGHAPDELYYPEQLQQSGVDEDGEVVMMRVPSKKPEGVPAELADVVIRAFDTAESWGINLEREIIRKMDFNETRPAKHGRRF